MRNGNNVMEYSITLLPLETSGKGSDKKCIFLFLLKMWAFQINKLLMIVLYFHCLFCRFKYGQLTQTSLLKMRMMTRFPFLFALLLKMYFW